MTSLLVAKYHIAQFQRDNGYVKQSELEPIVKGGSEHTFKSVLTVVLATLLLAEDLHCNATSHSNRHKSFTSEDYELYFRHRTENDARGFLEDLHESLDYVSKSNRKCQGINVLITVLNSKLSRLG